MQTAFEQRHVCAVIVTYNPDGNFGERVARIAGQVGGLIIVDNGSDPEPLGFVEGASAVFNAALIRNGQNLGVATALNQGIMLADVKGYQWVLTLDQDSVPKDDMVETLIRIYAASTQMQKLAVVGSGYPHNAKLAPASSPGRCPSWVEQKIVMTSGTLMSTTAFRSIGPFREEFFIDHVDTEYCLRARSKGFTIVAASRPLMDHVIGAPSTHRLPWKQTETSNHPPIRRYYKTRNVIILLRTYLRGEPLFLLGALVSLLKSTLLMLLFERNRISKLRATATGIVHGCRSKIPIAS